MTNVVNLADYRNKKKPKAQTDGLDLSQRVERIKHSIERCNQLMLELKREHPCKK